MQAIEQAIREAEVRLTESQTAQRHLQTTLAELDGRLAYAGQPEAERAIDRMSREKEQLERSVQTAETKKNEADASSAPPKRHCTPQRSTCVNCLRRKAPRRHGRSSPASSAKSTKRKRPLG